MHYNQSGSQALRAMLWFTTLCFNNINGVLFNDSTELLALWKAKTPFLAIWRGLSRAFSEVELQERQGGHGLGARPFFETLQIILPQNSEAKRRGTRKVVESGCGRVA